MSSSALDLYWDYLTASLPPNESELLDEHLNESFFNLKRNDFLNYYKEWYIEEFRELIIEKILPKFWSLLAEQCLPENINTILHSDLNLTISFEIAIKLFRSVDYLHKEIEKCIENKLLNTLFNYLPNENLLDFKAKLKSQLRSLFLSKIKLHFKDYVLLTYFSGFCLSRAQYQFNRKQTIKQANNLFDASDEKDSLNIDESYIDINECQDENDESLFIQYDEDYVYDNQSDFNRCLLCSNLIDRDDESFNESDLSQMNEKCHCYLLLKMFKTMNKKLQNLDLLQVISEDAVYSVTHSFIEKKIRKRCSNTFDVSNLKSLENWVKSTIISWLEMVYEQNPIYVQTSENTEEMLIHFIYETYGKSRIDQLFDIIIEYPESEPALEDLKECLMKCSGFRSKVIKSLKDSFEVRLLHLGVGTSDILAAYVQAIKSLRVLDPSGVILQLVCDPVKKYLKNRDDTVRCIITALTDDNSELIPEFLKSEPQPIDEGMNQSDDEYILENWQNWKPDPMDAAAIPANSKSIRSADIVSILVNVYESKDLFVEEYQRLLAQRFLLNNFDFNIDQERRNLELLTVRFGESDLHACEVMLTDMSISKRINNRINTGEIANHHFKLFPIKCLILSEQFWPEKLGLPFSDEASNLRLSSTVELAIETYTKAFETIKGSRTLKWLKHLGTVDLELEFTPNKKLSFTVSPIHAMIITQFEQKTTWSINDLSQSLSLSTQVIRRKINFWQNKGVLKEDKIDHFTLIEDLDSNQANGGASSSANAATNSAATNVRDDFNAYDDDSFEKNVNTNNQLNEEKYRIYWSFVENMLTNLNSLPLERIHVMLQMFAFQGAKQNELSIQALRHFLDTKVRDQKLVFTQGQYQLAKND